MPTYVYRREDGTTFEIVQRITEDSLETCPTTGQTVKRVISGGTGFIFKGSGFYLTDYVRNNDKDKKSTTKSDDSTKKSSDSGEKSSDSGKKSSDSGEKNSKPTASKSDD